MRVRIGNGEFSFALHQPFFDVSHENLHCDPITTAQTFGLMVLWPLLPSRVKRKRSRWDAFGEGTLLPHTLAKAVSTMPVLVGSCRLCSRLRDVSNREYSGIDTAQ